MALLCLVSSETSWAQSAVHTKPQRPAREQVEQNQAERSAPEQSEQSEQAVPELTLGQARQAFLLGMRHLEADEFAEAERAFQRAAQGRATPGLLYYVAYSQEQQGHYVQALATYGKARQLLVETPAPDVERLVPAAIERVQGRTGSVDLVGLLQSDEVIVDGRPVDASVGILLDPGPHQLEILRDSGERVVVPFRLEAGQERQVTVPPVSARAPAEEEESPPLRDDAQAPSVSSSAPSLARPILIGTSVGLAVVGGGVAVFGAVHQASASRKSRDLRGQLDSDSACLDPVGDAVSICPQLQDALDQRSAARTTLAVGAVGAAAFGVAAVLLATLWKPPRNTKLSAQVVPRGGRLMLSGHF